MGGIAQTVCSHLMPETRKKIGIKRHYRQKKFSHKITFFFCFLKYRKGQIVYMFFETDENHDFFTAFLNCNFYRFVKNKRINGLIFVAF